MVSSDQWIQDSNTGGTAGTSITPQQGYILADPSVTSSGLNLGRYHVNGAVPTSAVTVSNSAPATSGNVTESLTVSQGSLSGGAQISGLPESVLSQGANRTITVGLDIGTGAQSGSVELTFNSVQEGSSSTRVGDPVSVGSRTISLSAFGYTGQSEWTANAGGSWNLSVHANWSSNGGTPGMDGSASVADTALFGNAATEDRTISLDGSHVALRSLTLSNASASYTIQTGSGGSVTLGNGEHGGFLIGDAGVHTISAPLVLGNDLTADIVDGSTIVLSGSVSGSSYGLTKTGAGILELSGSSDLSARSKINSHFGGFESVVPVRKILVFCQL